jgi:ABC-2 type transport system ATP-binding protein
VSRRIIGKRARELLDILGLYDKRHKLAKTLSGGMKRRLNFALGIVHDPDIIILDEPQAGLDPQSRLLVREYIRSLARRKTIILTTHEMHEADQLSDRIAIIDHGQLLVLDTPAELKNRMGQGDILEILIVPGQQKKAAAFLKMLPEKFKHLSLHNNCLQLVDTGILDILPQLIEMLSEGGIKTEDIKIRKKTLEDVFISLTGRRLRE